MLLVAGSKIFLSSRFRFGLLNGGFDPDASGLTLHISIVTSSFLNQRSGFKKYREVDTHSD
ncbi:MAG: hypothetical protein Q8J97_10005, partial [Flavobacteriaceae bacterium]|nr:hypothetical protein [Flavobacteriaceae bacterium]